MRATSVAVVGQRHAVGDADRAVGGLEVGLQHQRAVAVAALDA